MPKHTFTAGAIVTLRQILSVPGWAKSIEDIYRGGKILAGVLPNPPGGTPLAKEFEFEMETSDRDICKTALQAALAKEAVVASENLAEVIEKLEFVAKTKPAT